MRLTLTTPRWQLLPYDIGGTAVNGDDYQMLPGDVVIPAGLTSATIWVTPRDQGIVGGSKAVTLTLTASADNPSLSPDGDYNINLSRHGPLTIADDDVPVASIYPPDPFASPGDGTSADFTVTITTQGGQPASSGAAIAVNYAVAGTDTTATVTIPAGQSSATIDPWSIHGWGDPGSGAISLAAGDGYTVSTTNGLASLTVNPNYATVDAYTTQTVVSDQSSGVFTIELSEPSPYDTTVSYAMGGTPAAPPAKACTAVP